MSVYLRTHATVKLHTVCVASGKRRRSLPVIPTEFVFESEFLLNKLGQVLGQFYSTGVDRLAYTPSIRNLTNKNKSFRTETWQRLMFFSFPRQ